MEYFFEILKVGLWTTLPILLILFSLFFLKRFVNIPDYLSRKLLHLTASLMVIPVIIIPSTWWIAEISVACLLVGVIIILFIIERFAFYQEFFIEKYKHEVIISFVIYFLVMASLIAFFWLYRDSKYFVIMAILAWSLGDAAASTFGHLCGRNTLSGKLIEGTKSVEGSVACFVFAFAVPFIMLLVVYQYVWWLALLSALSTALGVTLAELFTKKGLDNLTCPLMAGIILFLFSLI